EAEPGQQRPPVASVAGVEPHEGRGRQTEEQDPEDAADADRHRQAIDEEQHADAYEQRPEHARSQAADAVARLIHTIWRRHGLPHDATPAASNARSTRALASSSRRSKCSSPRLLSA